jgi:hypothetical protein
MERVIRIGDHSQQRSLTHLSCDLLNQGRVSECVARSLQEQHRDINAAQVFSASDGWLACRVQRKAEERQTKNARKGTGRLGLRGHPAAERLATSEQRHRRKARPRFGNCRSNCCVCNWRWIRPAATFLHVWELIPQRGNAPVAKPCRNGSHERMRHAGTRTMCEHEARAVMFGNEQQT